MRLQPRSRFRIRRTEFIPFVPGSERIVLCSTHGWQIFALWAMLLPAVALAENKPASRPVGNPGDCELVLENKHVESLVLLDPQGLSKLVEVSGTSVYLPQGKYQLQAIQFQGGVSSHPNSAFTLSPEKPCHVNVETPVTPKIAVTREGGVLRLDYQLFDDLGNNCAGKFRKSPPEFAVYLGVKKIGSGRFEYG
jgi:hypothetical protein